MPIVVTCGCFFVTSSFVNIRASFKKKFKRKGVNAYDGDVTLDFVLFQHFHMLRHTDTIIDDQSAVFSISFLVCDFSCFRSYCLVQALVFVLWILYEDFERIDLRLFHRLIEQCKMQI